MENDCLSKVPGPLERALRKNRVQKDHQLPKTRRCELLGIVRSSSYYQPKSVSDNELALMELIDRLHMDKPFIGSRRIVEALTEQGIKTDRKHVQRLMRLMGIQAIYPGPKSSKRDLDINRTN